jgi:hypothetical protein
VAEAAHNRAVVPRGGVLAVPCPEDEAAQGIHVVRWEPVGGVGLLEVVQGSFSHRDENMSDACLYGSGGSDMFQKAPPANFTGLVMPGDCWIGLDSVERTHVFI